MKPIGLIILATLLIPLASATDLTGCANITSSGYYVLLNNVTSTATCFNISADDVDLNCNGYGMKYSSVEFGYGVVSAADNITVRNCSEINQTTDDLDYSDGIYFNGSTNGLIYSNRIVTTFANIRGVVLDDSSNISVLNNTISTNNANCDDIHVLRGLNITTANNTLSTSWINSYGIYGLLNNSLISDNRITTSSSGDGIIFQDSVNNNLTRNTITTSGTRAGGHVGGIVFCLNSKNNNLLNNVITTSGKGMAFFVISSDDNTFTDNYVYNNLWDFWTNTSLNTRVFNLTTSSNRLNFTGYNFVLNTSSSPGSDPSGYSNVSRYVNATEATFTDAPSWLFLNVSYNDADVPTGYNASNVTIWRYSSGAWSEVSGSGVNRAGNYSFANITSFSVFAPMAGLNSTSSPVITAFYDMADITPISCSVKSLGVTRFNVSDSDGASDINLSATYVEIVPFSGGLVVTQSATCVNDTSVIHSNPNEMTINCTGGVFNYYTPALMYKAFLYVADNSGSNSSYLEDGIYFNYNKLVSATVSPLISFGNLVRGSSNNLNNNIPSWNMTNCGNVELSTNITGMNISDGGSHYLPATNFRVSNDTSPIGDVVVSESPADLTSLVHISPALDSYRNLWFFVDISESQFSTTYDTGYWTWTPFEP